jgi:hypothetical protein
MTFDHALARASKQGPEQLQLSGDPKAATFSLADYHTHAATALAGNVPELVGKHGDVVLVGDARATKVQDRTEFKFTPEQRQALQTDAENGMWGADGKSKEALQKLLVEAQKQFGSDPDKIRDFMSEQVKDINDAVTGPDGRKIGFPTSVNNIKQPPETVFYATLNSGVALSDAISNVVGMAREMSTGQDSDRLIRLTPRGMDI